jgi:hypothetical protein
MTAGKQNPKTSQFKYIPFMTKLGMTVVLLALGERQLYGFNPALFGVFSQLMFWLAVLFALGAVALMVIILKKYPHVKLPAATAGQHGGIGGKNMTADQLIGIILVPAIFSGLLSFVLHGNVAFAKLYLVSLREWAVIFFASLGIRMLLLIPRFAKEQSA